VVLRSYKCTITDVSAMFTQKTWLISIVSLTVQLASASATSPGRQETFVNDDRTLSAFLLAVSGYQKHVDTIRRELEASGSWTQVVGTLTDEHLCLLRYANASTGACKTVCGEAIDDAQRSYPLATICSLRK
jgi:hypothetical protein